MTNVRCGHGRPWRPFWPALRDWNSRPLLRSRRRRCTVTSMRTGWQPGAEREKRFASLLLPTSIVEAVSTLAGGGAHEAAVPGEPYGPAWGRLVHALLQYAALAPGCSREDLEGRARWHAMGDPLAQPFADGAVAAVLNLMTSAFWAHISEATVRLTEVPLMAEIPAFVTATSGDRGHRLGAPFRRRLGGNRLQNRSRGYRSACEPIRRASSGLRCLLGADHRRASAFRWNLFLAE